MLRTAEGIDCTPAARAAVDKMAVGVVAVHTAGCMTADRTVAGKEEHPLADTGDTSSSRTTEDGGP